MAGWTSTPRTTIPLSSKAEVFPHNLDDTPRLLHCGPARKGTVQRFCKFWFNNWAQPSSTRLSASPHPATSPPNRISSAISPRWRDNGGGVQAWELGLCISGSRRNEQKKVIDPLFWDFLWQFGLVRLWGRVCCIFLPSYVPFSDLLLELVVRIFSTWYACNSVVR